MALHVDIPSCREIERLLQARGEGLISIYLPTTPNTPDAEGDGPAAAILRYPV